MDSCFRSLEKLICREKLNEVEIIELVNLIEFFFRDQIYKNNDINIVLKGIICTGQHSLFDSKYLLCKFEEILDQLKEFEGEKTQFYTIGYYILKIEWNEGKALLSVSTDELCVVFDNLHISERKIYQDNIP